jgi:nucleotide-binding universal stress UspA family protein
VNTASEAAGRPVSVSHQLPVGAAHPRGVLAAVDGSDGSLWALDRALDEAEAHGLPLYVLAVVNPSPVGPTPGMAELVQESVDRLMDGMRDVVLRGIAAALAVRRTPYAGQLSLHVVQGNVIEQVLTACAAQHTAVVGARGNGGFSRLLLGSVATALVHHAGCPVLVVPGPPAGASPEPDRAATACT